ncbi:NACHT, LRR and PYD domains-containing protein 3 isoform X1 [Esox lucius]|uniref:NACHT, LRR and PYD domains-containing protein 3 isoform X1 n=1 Tax=Esox lucius TaxID=8010 RepID=UPI00147757AC|nr:NACHT, LRR and PYD domains-containing protein 3 isoform X1 [Esox lucius]
MSQIIKCLKHKSKQRKMCQGKDKENRTPASMVENDDEQVMDVTTPSMTTHVGGALAENRNATTADNGSSVFAPNISGCVFYGDVNVQEIKTISDQDEGKQKVNPGSNLIAQHKQNKDILCIRDKIKVQQKKRCETILEDISSPKKSALNKVYTELYIVTCDSTSINKEHEVWHAETAHLRDASKVSMIKCQDIFKPEEEDEDTTIRTVMTKGIAGIGKSVAVQKLNLDWANGKANQDLDFVFLLSFRALNLIKDQYSLHKLLQEFYPQLKEIDMITYDEHKILFILDGLDESKLRLEFDENRLNLTSVSESATLDVLLMNLIAGPLLPNALIWITSRPVASNQIPSQYIDRVTEIRGFNDAQKDEYFQRKISDPETARHIISLIKTSRSLYIMCHIPVFCWMAVTVLEDILLKGNKEDPKPQSLPTTITEMYLHYLRIQTNISSQKHRSTGGTQCTLMSNKDIILKLGKLAYDNLESQNVLFTEQDLSNCGISVTEAATCPGLCTELVEFEYGLYPKKLYCFVHLSVQEFFAALYAFHEFENNRFDSLKALRRRKGSSRIDFLKGAIDSALNSKNGHLDLFTRFLVGLSHESSRDILQGILERTNSSSECHKKLNTYIKNLKRKDLSPERCLNLIHCLLQLKEHSILQKDNNEASSDTPLTPFQCSLLAYKFIISEKPQEFDFRNKKTSDEGFYRLAPALLSCTTALLNFCHITPLQCATVASVLRSEFSRLTVLDLGHNNLGDAGVKHLCDGLGHPNCKVKSLNLSHNNVGNQGVEELCRVLTRPKLKLLILDLSCNDFGDSGLKLLAYALHDGSTLQVLRLSGCSITLHGDVKSVLDIALRSDPFQMKELDLSYNPIRETDLDFPQELNLIMDPRAESRNEQGLYKYACELTLDPNTVNSLLLLSKEDRKVTRLSTNQQYPNTEERFDACIQVLCKESLCQRHYLEVECLHNVKVGMAYRRIIRKGVSDCVRLGHNADSWALYTSESKSYAQHSNILHSLHIPEIKAGAPYRLGVFLDWPAGILSFYMVNNGKPVPLYAYYSTFTEPLYFAIGLNSPTATVSL